MAKKKSKLNKKGILKANQKIFDRYVLLRTNELLTKKSIDSICNNDIRLYLQWLGKRKLWEVDHNIAADFMNHCRTDRKNQNITLDHKFSSLHKLYDVLIIQEVKGLARNPFAKLTRPKKRKKEAVFMEISEYEQLMDYLDKKKDLRGAAMVSLFVSSGCRVSEIRQLQRNSLDFDSLEFVVLGKGEKERTCIFSEDARDRTIKYLGSRTDNKPWLFNSQCNTWLTTKSMQEFVKKAVERAGIGKHITPHSLRHTCAMLLLDNTDVYTIKEHLGHENINTTQIYAKMRKSKVKENVHGAFRNLRMDKAA